MSEQERGQQVIELAEEIMGLCEEGTMLSHLLLRKCQRLCSLAEVEDLVLWTKWELQGLSKAAYGSALSSKDDNEKLAANRFCRTRRAKHPKSRMEFTLFQAAPELESLYVALVQAEPSDDAYPRLTAVQLATVIERIKNEVHGVACEILAAYKFGDVVQGIFEQARSLVDARLVSLAPDAARELEAAYSQLGSAATPEQLAGAANSCRRALGDLADKLRPAGEGKDYGHDCGSDNYVNRLCAYACDQIESKTTTAVLVADINYLAARIDTVNKLAHKGTHHKGTHHEFTLIEARMCLIHTYLIVADLLQLARVDDPAEDQGE